MSIVIWHGTISTPIAIAISRSSAGLATRCCFASLRIIQGPIPRKFIVLSFRWAMPGRFIADIICCIQFSPVIRTPSRTKVGRPQKVTKIVVFIPIAAAVEARISWAQTFSRSPL